MTDEDFTTMLSRHVATFKTKDQTILVRRDLLREAFFSLEPYGCGSRLTIITKGPTYSFELPKLPDDLEDQINAFIADLG